MARTYLLLDHLTPVPPTAIDTEDARVVAVFSAQELASQGQGFSALDKRESLLYLSTIENTYLDIFPDYLIGSFAVPNKKNPLENPACFAFYLDKDHLVFLDEDDTCARLLDTIAKQGIVRNPSIPHCLYEFMKLLIKDDLTFLADLEDRMEDIEERIMDTDVDDTNRTMLGYRRKLLRIDTYYQQLADMAGSLSENENRLFTREESRLFVVLEKQAERLLKRSQTLKEYSLQLRELYQTQIDIQQNDTMKLFTVITVLFAPLTLIASWFGMNFANMPGLNWSWGYPTIVILSLVIIIAELIVFKRKKWL